MTDLWIRNDLRCQNPCTAGQGCNYAAQETKRSWYQDFVCKFLVDDGGICARKANEPQTNFVIGIVASVQYLILLFHSLLWTSFIGIIQTAIHECYVKYTLNPFSKIRVKIQSPCAQFETNIQSAMDKYNNAVKGNWIKRWTQSLSHVLHYEHYKMKTKMTKNESP